MVAWLLPGIAMAAAFGALLAYLGVFEVFGLLPTRETWWTTEPPGEVRTDH